MGNPVGFDKRIDGSPLNVSSEHVQQIPQFAEYFRMVEKKKSDLSTKECNVVCSPSPNIQHGQRRLLLTYCLAEGVYTIWAI